MLSVAGPFHTINLGERCAAIWMRIWCRDDVMIAGLVDAHKYFVRLIVAARQSGAMLAGA
ncbi:hypothetical protein AU467_33540 [Mesorhizobium loti]|uniref:Uncharacterized protein n=1 Tax=Rhizobium loti TaxID=381 RepID=A0A117N1G5_RHILI|nr:hypothetical protein AU467_33540 [Mesorhizobium loti]